MAAILSALSHPILPEVQEYLNQYKCRPVILSFEDKELEDRQLDQRYTHFLMATAVVSTLWCNLAPTDYVIFSYTSSSEQKKFESFLEPTWATILEIYVISCGVVPAVFTLLPPVFGNLGN
ncbi:hypothetical protein HDU76_008612 [Blyttiomyces sp. JEL0837]|nr:hypothetical protein HDU76_008612 [Blyttiomyces sp. JEL0837]